MEKDSFKKLERFLKTKEFKDLTSEEQAWVDEYISVSYYQELRQSISRLSKERGKNVSPHLKQGLMRDFKKHHQSKTYFFQYHVPAYAAFFAMFFVGFTVFLLRPEKELIVERTVEVQVPMIDTIWMEKPSDTVFLVKEIRVEVPATTQLVNNETPAEPMDSKKGKPMAEQGDLVDLLVSSD